MNQSLNFRLGRRNGVRRFTPTEHAAHYRARHPSRQAENRRRHELAHPICRILNSARARARKANLPFGITEADLLPLPTHCPVLGLRLLYGRGNGRKSNCASLDRIDNSKGYVKGNVAVISLRANELKRDGNLAELEAIVRWLRAELALMSVVEPHAAPADVLLRAVGGW